MLPEMQKVDIRLQKRIWQRLDKHNIYGHGKLRLKKTSKPLHTNHSIHEISRPMQAQNDPLEVNFLFLPVLAINPAFNSTTFQLSE